MGAAVTGTEPRPTMRESCCSISLSDPTEPEQQRGRAPQQSEASRQEVRHLVLVLSALLPGLIKLGFCPPKGSETNKSRLFLSVHVLFVILRFETCIFIFYVTERMSNSFCSCLCVHGGGACSCLCLFAKCFISDLINACSYSQ